MEMLKKWVFEYLTAFFLIKSKKYKKVYKKDNFQIKIIFFFLLNNTNPTLSFLNN